MTKGNDKRIAQAFPEFSGYQDSEVLTIPAPSGRGVSASLPNRHLTYSG